MADPTKQEQKAADKAAEIDRNNQQAMTDQKPVTKLSGSERAVDPPRTDAAGRLRAFEDDVFGKRAVRFEGKIERGVGSPYAAMTDERKAQYAALEDLVAAEQELSDATVAVGVAEAKRVAAEERLAMADKLAQEKAAAAEKEKADAAG